MRSVAEFDERRLSGDAGPPAVKREPPPDTVSSACLLQQRRGVSNLARFAYALRLFCALNYFRYYERNLSLKIN